MRFKTYVSDVDACKGKSCTGRGKCVMALMPTFVFVKGGTQEMIVK